MIVQTGGGWVHVREAGDPARPPLLLVQGLGASGRAWSRLLPHLEPHARLLLVDNRGTGDSDRVRAPLTMPGLALDLVAVLDAAEVERAHVLGLSFGGMVVQHLALDHPGRVASLVLGCTTAGGALGRWAPPWRLLASGAVRRWAGDDLGELLLSSELYARRTVLEAREVLEEDRALREGEGTPGRTVAAQLLAAAAHDVRARLPALEGLPVTVVHGEEDRVVPPQDARELAAAIPGARLVMIPACGHMVTTDATGVLAQVVLGHVA